MLVSTYLGLFILAFIFPQGLSFWLCIESVGFCYFITLKYHCCTFTQWYWPCSPWEVGCTASVYSGKSFIGKGHSWSKYSKSAWQSLCKSIIYKLYQYVSDYYFNQIKFQGSDCKVNWPCYGCESGHRFQHK